MPHAQSETAGEEDALTPRDFQGATSPASVSTPLPDVDPAERVAPFASPFDELGPSTLAQRAAHMLQAELRAGVVAEGVLAASLDEPCGGKMFGVLVVEDRAGRCGFLRAFSGMLDGRFDVPGYAPPIFDRAARTAIEPAGEAIVKRLMERAAVFAASAEVVALRRAEHDLTMRHAAALAEMRARHHRQRAERRARRHAASTASPPLATCEAVATPEPLAAREPLATRDDLTERLAQQSRRDKAERRALDAAHARELHDLAPRLRAVARRHAAFDRLRRMVSRRLMLHVHDAYGVTSVDGATRALRELYAPAVPPAGAGDCVAPKLLAYSRDLGLRPLALAEFWWGAPPAGGGRVAGAFYPACRDKCGPLLPFMLEGLAVAPRRRFEVPDAAALELRVLFADAWIVVVDKPCGLLSVPSRSARPDDSVAARLARSHPGARLVHRLDLDTSGVLIAARDQETQAALQRQFLTRTVEKRYAAIVAGPVTGPGGLIELALRVDVEDRPRQIHDPVHGRSAITAWRRVGTLTVAVGDRPSTRTRVEFLPRTGRTHQLRVHAAHPRGLGAPIVGDRLYGHAGERLLLHAEAVTFAHPATGERVTFRSPAPF